jgi:hypothetical protein
MSQETFRLSRRGAIKNRISADTVNRSSFSVTKNSTSAEIPLESVGTKNHAFHDIINPYTIAIRSEHLTSRKNLGSVMMAA